MRAVAQARFEGFEEAVDDNGVLLADEAEAGSDKTASAIRASNPLMSRTRCPNTPLYVFCVPLVSKPFFSISTPSFFTNPESLQKPRKPTAVSLTF